jgi:hypothetical protein
MLPTLIRSGRSAPKSGPLFLGISYVFRLDHDNLACKNAPIRAPTLAVGMAQILASLFGGQALSERFAWVTIVPATWLVVCTVTAGLEKVLNPNPAVGFIAHAFRLTSAIASGQVLAHRWAR